MPEVTALPSATEGALHLFISPHFDDAVACCGGTIATLVAAGNCVLVYTLFSGAIDPPYSTLAMDLHRSWHSPRDPMRLRHAEDEAACALLGCKRAVANVPEAIYRRRENGIWSYHEPPGLFGPLVHEDVQYVLYFQRALEAYVEEHTQIYVPLGIGNHVDHSIAHALGQALVYAGHQVWYYEDFPYALDPQKYQQRLAASPGLRSAVCCFGEEEQALKVRAFGYYASQIESLFGTTTRMRIAFQQHARSMGSGSCTFGERYWSQD